MQDPRERERYFQLRLENVAAVFRKRGFEAQVFPSAEAGCDFFYSQVQRTDVIGFGGSNTLVQLGVLDRLRAGGFNLLDRSKPGITPEEKGKIERQAFAADIFLASANAVSEEGAIVNIDMWGNRTAAIEFGPKKVFLFVGRNKLAAGMTEAIERARNRAAVMNCLRFEKRTPCVADAKCHDCSTPERICSVLSIIERSAPVSRISLILINDDLGF